MSEPVIYMRGYPPHLLDAVTEELVKDLGAIQKVLPENLDEIARALSNAEGFLDSTTLNSHLRAVLAEDAAVASLRRVILNIQSDKIEDVIKQLRAYQSNNPEEFPLSAENVDQLADLLPRLLKPFPALRRFRKAEQLTRITGQPLEDIQFICDLRPVFDEAREKIEGLIPYTHLKIVATGGDGLPNVFEAELSAQQVSDLAEQAEKAKRKLAVLYDKSRQWADYGMPNVPVTRIKEKGSSDA